MRIWIFLLLPFALTAFEGEIESSQEIQPWFTGPLLTTSGNIVPIGHVATQPYIFGLARTAFYDNQWHSQSIETLASLQFRTPVWIGLTSWADVRIAPVWMWNHRSHQSQWTLGDWSIQLNFQLHQDSLPYKNWLPSIKLMIRETFPTGPYQKLNPNKLGTDGGGRGAYTTMFGLGASKIFYFSGYHFLDLRLNMAYSIPTNVHVRGYNNYGGGNNTNGTVSPEREFFAIISFEYSLNRNWGISCDIEGVVFSKVTFKGRPGTVPAQDSLVNPTGVPASNERLASIQYSAAPGIQYNWSENLGVIGGVWFTFAGKNSSRFTSGLLSLNYFH